MKTILKSRNGTKCNVEMFASYSSVKLSSGSIIKMKLIFLGRKKSFTATVQSSWLFDRMCEVLIDKKNQIDGILLPTFKAQILDFLDETLEIYDEED